MKPKPNLGDQELEVLQYVTDHPAVTVREVFLQFGEPRGLARTTILTTMENLRTKGYLARAKAGSLYRYTAVVPKGELLRNLLADFVRNTLKGSVSPFAAYLAEAREVPEAELKELEAVLEQLRAERKGSEP
jgi:predicted transcriptional regulator